MEIRRSSLKFNNVLCAKTRSDVRNWYKHAQELRNAVIRNGLYATGPIFYKVENFDKEKQEGDYSFYIPVNNRLKMKQNSKYTFYNHFLIEDGLALRHVDLEENLEDSYDIIRACAKSQNFKITEPFYNIYLDVYGSGIIDIFAPIKEEN